MRAKLLVALVGVLAWASAGAQVGIVLGGEVRGSAGLFSPQGGPPSVSLGSSAALGVDYSHSFGKLFSWNLSYLYADVEAEGPSPHGPASIRRTFPVQAFTFSLVLTIPASEHLEPYVGAGAGVMGTTSGAGARFYMEERGTFYLLEPKGGLGHFSTGLALQAGLNWKVRGPFLVNFGVRYFESGIEMERFRLYRTGRAEGLAHEGSYTLEVNPLVLHAGVAFRW